MAQPARNSSLPLSWRRCGGEGHWCKFLQLNLKRDSLAKGGVYVIWFEEPTGARKTVYVGQGKPVADCLARHRERTPITRHQKDGHILRVTWAKVGKEERGGVERYLADTLDPLEGDRWSNDDPVRVNLPWQ
jgi:hypothetical protein